MNREIQQSQGMRISAVATLTERALRSEFLRDVSDRMIAKYQT
jgi:hypothetical protein